MALLHGGTMRTWARPSEEPLQLSNEKLPGKYSYIPISGAIVIPRKPETEHSPQIVYNHQKWTQTGLC